VGPQSWKRFLFPPEERLWQLRRTRDGFALASTAGPAPRYAFLGVRSCDLAAIGVQDRVFVHRDPAEPGYAARREGAFIVAVQCTQPAGTCFCVSMGTGPRAREGFDLALTEVIEQGEHYLVVEVGSERGREVLAEVQQREATAAEVQAADAAVAEAAGRMGRALDTTDIKALLYRSMEHPRWSQVAERCLACANCTMVCPTCFCSTVEDTSDVTGEHAERWRRWDSCFTGAFSYIHGGSVRPSIRARYRQWMTHKLASWFDQFGTSGCVGCGRCITWCPVGIDITEEVAAIAASPAAAEEEP
jgi:sulfhydrogenase subunit beta (sulfur reductase)